MKGFKLLLLGLFVLCSMPMFAAPPPVEHDLCVDVDGGERLQGCLLQSYLLQSCDSLSGASTGTPAAPLSLMFDVANVKCRSIFKETNEKYISHVPKVRAVARNGLRNTPNAILINDFFENKNMALRIDPGLCLC